MSKLATKMAQVAQEAALNKAVAQVKEAKQTFTYVVIPMIESLAKDGVRIATLQVTNSIFTTTLKELLENEGFTVSVFDKQMVVNW